MLENHVLVRTARPSVDLSNEGDYYRRHDVT